jgi:hypothetical protein
MFSPATIWILIPLVALIGGFITKWMRINAENDRRLAGDEKMYGELADAVRRLEERVSNLERAVTNQETERKFAL